MRIPTREEFTPLPEAVAILQTQDPLEILPLLENQLESVSGATTQVRDIAAGFQDIADRLEMVTSMVTWDGLAGERFRSAVAEEAQALRLAAGGLTTAADEDDESARQTNDTIAEILIKIAATAGAIAALLTLLTAFGVGAAILLKAAAIVGLIGALAFFIYAFLEELIFLATHQQELIRRLIEAGREAYEQLRERFREWFGPDRGSWREPDPTWRTPAPDHP